MSCVRGLEQENARPGELVLKVSRAGLRGWGKDEMVNPARNKLPGQGGVVSTCRVRIDLELEGSRIQGQVN